MKAHFSARSRSVALAVTRAWHGEAVRGMPDRGLQEVAPGDRGAEVLLAEAVGREETIGSAGHGERRQRPAGRDRREPVTAVYSSSGARRGRPRGLERTEARSPRIPAEPEAVAPEPRHAGTRRPRSRRRPPRRRPQCRPRSTSRPATVARWARRPSRGARGRRASGSQASDRVVGSSPFRGAAMPYAFSFRQRC